MPKGRQTRHAGKQHDCISGTSIRVSQHSRAPTDSERQAFGDLIRRLTMRRVELRITQLQLDDMLGITDGLTAKWESLARFPSMFMLACWCSALRVTLVPVHPEAEPEIEFKPATGVSLVESR